jgi:hypothetical protein
MWLFSCIATLIFINFVWTGKPIIYLMFGVGICLQFARSVKAYIILCILGLVSLLIFYSRFIGLLSLKVLGVSEYKTPTFWLYYLYAGICIYVIWQSYRCGIFSSSHIKKFFIGIFVFNLVLSIFLARFTLFSSVFLILLLILEEKPYIDWILKIGIFISIFYLIISFWGVRPNIDRDYETGLKMMDKNISVLSWWDNGHIIHYVTGLNVIYKAYPSNQDLFIKGYMSDPFMASVYLDQLVPDKHYYLVLRNIDYEKALYYNKGPAPNITIFNSTGFYDVVVKTNLYTILYK